jgi:hypothetical protein
MLELMASIAIENMIINSCKRLYTGNPEFMENTDRTKHWNLEHHQLRAASNFEMPGDTKFNKLPKISTISISNFYELSDIH